MKSKLFSYVYLLIFCYCSCEISETQKERLLNGFLNYYNSLPNQTYTSNEGILESTQQIDDHYDLVVNIKVAELQNHEATKLLTCTAQIQDLEDSIVVVESICKEQGVQNPSDNSTPDQMPVPQVEVTESTRRKPVELDNEIQRMNADITSGEQFIAIPRDQPVAPCIGCASHVNPQAPGVNDLANLGVRQLDLHEPTVKHSLESVLEVERQVQVVNGVRYILIQSVNFNGCSETQTENCISSKICKITILVKPWIRLPNGANYRSILSNNCTEDWQFGEDGEVLPELPSGGDNGNSSIDHDDIIHVEHREYLQSQPNQEKTLTDEELKILQEQIIPNSNIEESTVASTPSPDTVIVKKDYIVKSEMNNRNDNKIPATDADKNKQQSECPDKRKAIDELLNFFDFTGYQKLPTQDNLRTKRSYGDDLQILSLAEDFRDIKQSIESAKFVYEMAQAMVDYLNKIDIEVKNRVVKNVITAEEEIENHQRFIYIQAYVMIPCDKVECGPKDAEALICNGVIDSTMINNPQILNVFCYNDNKEIDNRYPVKDIDPNDLVLQNLALEAVRKIESESNSKYGLKINRIVAANTQITSGTLTKLSLIIDSVNCNKTVPWTLRVNCTVLEQLGSKICEIIIHERHWLKDRKITYSCTDRPADMRITKTKRVDISTLNDPKINEMLQEIIQYLETQSNRINKQKIVSIKSISSQIIAGFLTKIELIVGYTNCTDDSYASGLSNECELLIDEGTRLCKAQIWDRSWIMDGRQVEVSCDDAKNSGEDKILKRRSIDKVDHLDDISDENKNNLYKNLATESLNKYLDSSSLQQHYQVVKVDRVTVHKVTGKLTRIEFTISPTNCLIQSKGLLSSSNCYVVNSKNISRCHSKILEEDWLKKKQYFVNCNIKEQYGFSDEVKEKSLANSTYLILAEQSMKKYLHDTGNLKSHRVVKIEKVTKPAVPGFPLTIDFLMTPQNSSDNIHCSSTILEKHKLRTKDINITCQLQEKKHINELNRADSTKNPKYMEMAIESLQKYLEKNPGSNLIRVAFVDKVNHLADGVTKIRYLASQSEDDDGDTICDAKFLDQNQLSSTIDVQCHSIGTKLRITEITADDPNYLQYVQLADESLQKYIQSINSKQFYSIVNVDSVKIKWIEGVQTIINFTISPLDHDNIKMQGKRCISLILEKPWNHMKDINISCELEENLYRIKRQIPGGHNQKDPTEPQYKSLAEESLRKYVQDIGSNEVYEVVSIEKVTVQVVSGSLTAIDFTAKTGSNQEEIKCRSEIWEQRWINKKQISITCNPKKRNSRMKREIQINNISDNGKSSLRGSSNDEQDVGKEEYRLLAEESLRRYERRNTVHHKVLAVKRVTKRVVSGFKYEIYFDAAPTDCPKNVSKVQERSCKPVDDIIIYCYAQIWDRPWLKRKKIDVQCNVAENDDFDDYVSDLGTDVIKEKNTAISDHRKNDKRHKLLAEEAVDKYLNLHKKIYIHKVVDIYSVSENIADGIITKIEFTMSPTNCLRNEPSSNSCDLKLPLIVFHCNAKIWDRPYLKVEKEIKVTCKKLTKVKKHNKRESGLRNVRQIDEDEEVDEETTYYYADRAVQHINDRSDSNNLHKLITIHATKSKVQMNTLMVQMYIEIAETYCLRHHKDYKLSECEEMDGLNHRLCLARIWPSPDDELVVRHVSVVCDDDQDFASISGLNIPELLKLSIGDLENSPDNYYKLVHQGEPQIIPSLNSKLPIKINFIVATTNCSKDVNLYKNPFQCFIDSTIPSKACHSFIWLSAESRHIRYINAKCRSNGRSRRSPLDTANVTSANSEIQELVTASLQKLEMSSLHRYKQRVLQINSHSTKLTSGKVTTIDFDVGYTSCLKYEWVENITSCDFLEHLPRRHCVAQIWERLWINNGRNIDVNCVDDETPLENHIEFESAEMAKQLADEALKHIEAKYPHPKKQKIVRIFSLEKQVVAGIHYRMKVEVGFTDCMALSEQTNCKLETDLGLNKFCRVNVWVRPWTDHPPNYRVSCDFQEGATHDLYHHVQAEQLFYNFLTTYNPSYVNDYSEVHKRFEIFKNNVKKIHEFNVYEKGTARYGVTRFADLTYEEFSTSYMGLNTKLRNENLVPMKKAEVPNIKTPQSFDWRDYDAVTEVKDQGSCGSCWAFSVTGNIEGQWKMQSGQLVSLSEQELVDCDKMDNGCNGGLPDNAYRAIEQLGGLELESDYPYEAEDDKCVFNKTLAKVKISGAVNITSNETKMAQWLVHNGPISIGINANAMQFYMGGISHPWKMLCNPTNLDHGVLIIGYGVKEYPLFHKTLPYWVIKNSWGKSWGEQGYYRVYRGDGTCGVNQMASSAVI